MRRATTITDDSDFALRGWGGLHRQLVIAATGYCAFRVPGHAWKRLVLVLATRCDVILLDLSSVPRQDTGLEWEKDLGVAGPFAWKTLVIAASEATTDAETQYALEEMLCGKQLFRYFLGKPVTARAFREGFGEVVKESWRRRRAR